MYHLRYRQVPPLWSICLSARADIKVLTESSWSQYMCCYSKEPEWSIFYILFFVHCTVAPFKVLSCFDTIPFFLNVLSYFLMFPSLLLFSVILALSLIAWLLRPPPCLTKWIITIITIFIIHIIITITIIICIVKTVSKTMTMTLYLISILPCKLYICIYRFVFDIYWV